MEILDLKTEHIKESVKAGTILVLQGDNNKAFSILHSGLVEILSNDDVNAGTTSKDTIENSIRVGLIKGECLFGIMGIMHRETANTISIRTVTECIVSIQPMKTEDIVKKIQSDMPLNLKVLRALITRIESTFFLFNNYKYLWHKFASIADSIALGCKYSGTPENQEHISRINSSLEDYSTYLIKLMEEKKCPKPELWDFNLFLGRIQDDLDLYCKMDGLLIDDLIDNRQFLFIKRLIRKKDELLKAMFNNDEPINQYIFDFLGRTLESMLQANKKLAADIHSLIIVLFSENGWIKKIIAENDLEKKQIKDFLHYLAKFCWRCRKDTMKLLGKDLLVEYKIYSFLKQFKNSPLSSQRTKVKSGVTTVEKGNQLVKYKGLLQKILDFSDLSQDFKDEFTSLVKAFKSEKNKFSSAPEIQKLRSDLSIKYWQLYEVCFLKIIDSDLKGFVPGIMLHFGLVDEELVSKKELSLINEFYSRNLYSDESIPVMTLPYFLEKIYKSEVNPSLTEMGDVFSVILRKQEKMGKSQRENKYIFEDTAEDRVKYEIRMISNDLNGVLFGNKKKVIPFLCTEAFNGSMERFFIDSDSIVEKIDKYRKRDFTLFYREVMISHSLGKDFIQKEVLPNFVLYPCAGSRLIMWQDIDGTRKNTPGRFFLPIFYSEKLMEALLYQLASYRWELQKTIAGYNWTDPVDGGLVGSYYDYIQFYKKNPNITSEAKKRLEEFIKKSKSDKDRFAKDYITWVDFEYEGKVRLNTVARDIFYRFCPFLKDIRTEMAKKPLFGNLEMKFQNRRQKDLIKAKARKIKFEKSGVELPEDLVDYFKYLEM